MPIFSLESMKILHKKDRKNRRKKRHVKNISTIQLNLCNHSKTSLNLEQKKWVFVARETVIHAEVTVMECGHVHVGTLNSKLCSSEPKSLANLPFLFLKSAVRKNKKLQFPTWKCPKRITQSNVLSVKGPSLHLSIRLEAGRWPSYQMSTCRL